jgi:NADPH:quinone reductase-like Zn-dependent oxidoreductase
VRAALLTAYGGTVELGERPDPEPEPEVTLVRVSAAPIVPLDLICASGTSYFGQQPLPYVPGVQGVGVVESSPDLPAGQRVWFATSAGMAPVDGSLAEWCAVRAADLIPITADVPDAAAAALGTSGIAAWMSLRWRARLRAGERVVVLGASGVVGQVALAVARHLGAGRVVAVCRSEAAAQQALGIGADDVVVLRPDEERTDLTGRLTAAAGGPADVVIDPVFGEPAAAAAMALGPGGRLVNIGGAAHDRAEFSSAALRGRSIDILGYTNNAISADQRADALTQVLTLAARGEVTVAHQVIALADCAQAWASASGSGRRVVVAIGADRQRNG